MTRAVYQMQECKGRSYVATVSPGPYPLPMINILQPGSIELQDDIVLTAIFLEQQRRKKKGGQEALTEASKENFTDVVNALNWIDEGEDGEGVGDKHGRGADVGANTYYMPGGGVDGGGGGGGI